MTGRFAFTLLATCLLVSKTHAASSVIEKWTVDSSGSFPETYTASDSGATFGVLCSRATAQCLYYLASTTTTCEEGAVIPLLVNVESGASQMTGTCRVVGDESNRRFALVLSPFETANTIVSSGANLGIAMPLVEGQFRVYRFSLRGSSEAIRRIRSAASKANGDQTL